MGLAALSAEWRHPLGSCPRQLTAKPPGLPAWHSDPSPCARGSCNSRDGIGSPASNGARLANPSPIFELRNPWHLACDALPVSQGTRADSPEPTMLGPTKPRNLDEPITVSLDALVPPSNFYRQLEVALDLGFVRDWTRELYA